MSMSLEEECREEYILELLSSEGSSKKVHFIGDACTIGTGSNVDVRLKHADSLRCIVNYKKNMLQVLEGRVKVNGEIITTELKIHYPCIIEVADQLFRITKSVKEKETVEVKKEPQMSTVEQYIQKIEDRMDEDGSQSEENSFQESSCIFSDGLKNQIIDIEESDKRDSEQWECINPLEVSLNQLPDKAWKIISDLGGLVDELEDTDRELEPEMHSDDIERERQEKNKKKDISVEEVHTQEVEEVSTQEVNTQEVNTQEMNTQEAPEEINTQEMNIQEVVEEVRMQEVSTQEAIEEPVEESHAKEVLEDAHVQEMNMQEVVEEMNTQEVVDEINKQEMNMEEANTQEIVEDIHTEEVHTREVSENEEKKQTAETEGSFNVSRISIFENIPYLEQNSQTEKPEKQEISNLESIKEEADEIPSQNKQPETETQHNSSPSPMKEASDKSQLKEEPEENKEEPVHEQTEQMEEPVNQEIAPSETVSADKSAAHPSTPRKSRIKAVLPVSPAPPTPGRSIRRASISHQMITRQKAEPVKKKKALSDKKRKKQKTKK